MTAPGWSVPFANIVDGTLVSPSVAYPWFVDGVPLSNFTMAVTTKGGTRMKPPPLRGSDVQIPFMPGQFDVGRMVDSRTVDLEMWIKGGDAETGRIIDEEAFAQNWRALTTLIWNPRRQVNLSKSIDDQGQKLIVTGLARYADGLEPAMTGPMRADFSVSLFMADPYFYADPITVQVPVQADYGVPGFGDDVTNAVVVNVTGPAPTGFTITNRTTGTYFTYSGVLTANQSVAVDVKQFLATVTDDITAQPLFDGAAYMQQDNSPSPFFFDMAPGVNDLQGTIDFGVTYRPVYL